MKVEIATFRTIAKNWHFQPNISENTGSIVIKFLNSVDLRTNDKSYILRSSKGRCYGNLLFFGPKKYLTDTTFIRHTGVLKRIGRS